MNIQQMFTSLCILYSKKKRFTNFWDVHILIPIFFFIFLHRSLYWSLHCWLHVYYGLYRITSWNLPCEKLIGEKYLTTLPTSMMLKWTLPNKYIYSHRRYVPLLLYKYFFIRILNKFWIHLTVMIEYVNKEYNSSQQLA